jgi:hypothetical protein
MTHTFRVWAPTAQAVHIGGQKSDMSARDGGWWDATIGGAGPGAPYAFSIDDGPPRPDPRSPSQPEGVHRWSEIVDHSSFCWRHSGWRGLARPGSGLYELHVGTFTGPGTFDAVVRTAASSHRPGHRRHRAPAGGRVCRYPWVGLRRCRSFRSAPLLRRTRWAQAPGRRLSRTRSRRDHGCGVQPPRSVR